MWMAPRLRPLRARRRLPRRRRQPLAVARHRALEARTCLRLLLRLQPQRLGGTLDRHLALGPLALEEHSRGRGRVRLLHTMGWRLDGGFFVRTRIACVAPR